MTENTSTQDIIEKIDALDETALAPEEPAAKVVPNKAPAKAPAKAAAAKPAAKKAPAKKAPAKTVAKVDAPIEGEVITEPAAKPMSVTAAKALDKKVKAAASTAASALGTLRELLDEAQAGQIHVALGFTSWTAYLASINLPALDRQQTREAIEMLSDAGMGQHAIAETVGVSVGNVNKKVKEAAVKAEAEGKPKAPKVSTGKDGKTYTRTTPARKAGAAKASATKGKKAADSGRATGKPPSQKTVDIGNMLALVNNAPAASFNEGQIHNLRAIKVQIERILRDWDTKAQNNHTAKA